MNYNMLTIIGFTIIFIATTIGSALVFFFKNEISKKINAIFLGFASGVMLAASIWSLLIPAINESSNRGKLSFLPLAISFSLGGLFLILLDKIIGEASLIKKISSDDNQVKHKIKMFLAVLIHNIPEGLAVGFAFGASKIIGTDASYISALGLSIGIAIQNLPEGLAVSLPMRTVTKNNYKAFSYGVLSGVVEPIAAIIGFLLASKLSYFQPWFLSFAAGTMVFVIAEDLIPDSKLEDSPNLGSCALMIGFVIMMILDITLS